MLKDRFGLGVSTSSDAARDAYVEACEALLTLYPGEIDAFDRAIGADPGFALAHAGRARALQMNGDAPGAAAGLEEAVALSAGLPARERSQIDVFRLLLAGQVETAWDAVRAHLAEWPRDAMVLSTAASQLGLIGLSGRAGRERELAAFLRSLAPHYGADWWFAAHYGMALSEVGEHGAAEPLLERSLADNPRNAFIGHALAHLRYEEGDAQAGIAFMQTWLPSYPRAGRLHGHLAWHLALSELAVGNVKAGWQLYTDAFAAEEYSGMALIKVIDATSFLWRAELAGHPREPARWQGIHAFARRMFPGPANAYVDWHVALAEAVAGEGGALEERLRGIEELERAGRYPAGSLVPAVARAFAAFARQDYAATIERIEPILAERERIGGSQAQLDLLEFTLMRAYVEAGRLDELRRLLQRRRIGARVPVAGVDAVH
jgi:tetratricopeptide (TPR) repeat protein